MEKQIHYRKRKDVFGAMASIIPDYEESLTTGKLYTQEYIEDGQKLFLYYYDEYHIGTWNVTKRKGWVYDELPVKEIELQKKMLAQMRGE